VITKPSSKGREQLIDRVHNWVHIEKREIVSRFLIDENSLPNFFHIPSVLFAPVYQQVIIVLSTILGNDSDMHIDELMFCIMNDIMP